MPRGFVRELSGQRFGRLVAYTRATNTPSGETSWYCICDCSRPKVVMTWKLVSGHTRSCGCLSVETTTTGRNRTHGLARTKENSVWKSMLARCNNPNKKDFRHYGGRGIKVCARWRKFENFYADMGPRPTPKHSIDRRDVNGNYTPANCHWATPDQQANNKRKSVRKVRT